MCRTTRRRLRLLFSKKPLSDFRDYIATAGERSFGVSLVWGRSACRRFEHNQRPLAQLSYLLNPKGSYASILLAVSMDELLVSVSAFSDFLNLSPIGRLAFRRMSNPIWRSFRLFLQFLDRTLSHDRCCASSASINL